MVTGTPTAGLAQELATLKKLVGELQDELRGRHRVTLGALTTQPYLGQPVSLTATVTGLTGAEEKRDVPVTFVTTWGKLRSADGYTTQEGSTITALTGINGVARVTLFPPVYDDLLDSQRKALQAMLATLDASAATPRDAQDGLQGMVRQYRWDVSVPFRQAVDALFQEFRSQYLERVIPRNYLERWYTYDLTVLAFAAEVDELGAATSSVQGLATLRLNVRDWLGPWLQTYQAMAAAESNLRGQLEGAKQRSQEAGAILDGIYSRVRDFVDGQWGIVGKYIGRTVAEETLRDFAASRLEDLPLESRAMLTPSLLAARGTLQAGASVLGAISQTQANLRQEISTTVGKVDNVAIADLNGRVATLETQLTLKADLSALQAALADKVTLAVLDSRLTSKVEVAAFNAVLANKLDEAAFTAFQTSVQESLNSKVEVAAFNAALANKLDIAEVDSRLAAKVDVSAFNSAVSSKLDVGEFTSFRDSIRNVLEGKVDLATFESLLATKVDQSTFERELAGKVDQSTFDAELAGKVDQSTFERELAQKVNTATFDSAFQNIRGDFTTLENSVTSLGNNLLSTRVDLLNTTRRIP